jgi:hypothetical protein
MASDSSGSYSRSHSSSSRYTDRDAHKFKAERDTTRLELETISKDVGIAELEWEHQRKQLLQAVDGESYNPLNLNSILNLPSLGCDSCRPRRRAQSAESGG